MTHRSMLTVTCAIIEAGDLVLAAQRGSAMDLPHHWEFPGGKVQSGETYADCIVREIKEELNLVIQVLSRFAENHWEQPEGSLRLISFRCRYCGGEPILSEHARIAWLQPRDLPSLVWCPADIPIVEAYVKTVSDKESSLCSTNRPSREEPLS